LESKIEVLAPRDPILVDTHAGDVNCRESDPIEDIFVVFPETIRDPDKIVFDVLQIPLVEGK
jgi:hypothetical protein